MSTPQLHCPAFNKTDEWAFQFIREFEAFLAMYRQAVPNTNTPNTDDENPDDSNGDGSGGVFGRSAYEQDENNTGTEPTIGSLGYQGTGTGAQHQNSHGTTQSGGWTPTRGRNPTGYNSSSIPNPYTHTTSNTTCLQCNDDNDSGSDSDYEDALSENNDDLGDEESSICRKIIIHLNEIDIPDWTSIVFDRLRWNRMLNSTSI
jgi:hypothetical protein